MFFGLDGPFVVVYHHLTDDDKDPLVSQLGVTTSPEVFVSHMRFFAKNFDLVSASELLSPKAPRRSLLITFDDFYRSVLDVGGPILRELNAPSIFFLNPAVVMSETLSLDNLLSLAAEQLGMKELSFCLGLESCSVPTIKHLILDHVAAMRPPRIEEVKARILQVLGTTVTAIRRDSRLFLDEDDVRALSDYQIDVGNHSMTHAFFRSLSAPELTWQIEESRTALQRLSGKPVSCMSVPYGSEKDLTPKALAVARSCGHKTIFLVHGRSNRFRRDSDLFFRIDMKNTRPELLPIKLHVTPGLRSVRSWLTRRAQGSILAYPVYKDTHQR